MRAFLVRLERPEVEAQYRGLDTRWEGRLARLEARLSAEGLPLSVAGMSSVWTVLYTRPSRYNWMFQYYLRAEGLALSWVGTGRLIFPIDLSEADFDAVTEGFVRAGRRMLADGFWWSSPETTNAGLRRRVSMEMLRARLGI
jgi:glutamate-1-semialdehyde 2,1-aminomutase